MDVAGARAEHGMSRWECGATKAVAEANMDAEAAKQATAVIALARTKLIKMAEDLAAVKAARTKEAAEAQAYRRKVEECKRQKTLHAFFARPLEHEARPRAPPEALGEGYTARNISSGTFANHVRAIETSIIQTADDPLKQLQLAAAVNQRMQGIRQVRDQDQEVWG